MVLAVGYVAQTGFQMVYFLVLVRLLGPDLFGRFAAALAAIMLVSPLAGLGYAEVALVRVSQRPQDAGLWALNAIVATMVMGLLVSIGLALGNGVLMSDQWLDSQYVFGLALSELVITRCCGVIARIHQASGQVAMTALNNSLLAAGKAGIASALYLSGVRSLGVLVATLVVGLLPLAFWFYLVLVRRRGPMSFSWIRLRQEFWLAFSFTTGMTSQVIYTDLDKLYLARWTTPYVVGTYTAGYKILTLAFMPIRAVLEATLARQFQLATDNRSQCIRFTSKLLAVNVGMASMIAVCLYFLAPFATLFLGSEFQESVAVLRIGFLLPVIQAVHYVLGNYLTAIGRQAYRTLNQIVTLIVYVISGYIVIQHYSWPGAVYCSLVSETCLAVLFAVGCVYFTRLDRAQHVSAQRDQVMVIH